MNYLTLIPAYGRDYKSQKEVQDGWQAGHDFQIMSLTRAEGSYINKNDAPKGYCFNIRYKKMTQICVIKAN